MKATIWTPSAIRAYVNKHGSFPPSMDPKEAPTVRQKKFSPGRYSIIDNGPKTDERS